MRSSWPGGWGLVYSEVEEVSVYRGVQSVLVTVVVISELKTNTVVTPHWLQDTPGTLQSQLTQRSLSLFLSRDSSQSVSQSDCLFIKFLLRETISESDNISWYWDNISCVSISNRSIIGVFSLKAFKVRNYSFASKRHMVFSFPIRVR